MQSDIVHIKDFLVKDRAAVLVQQYTASSEKARILIQGLSGSRDSFLIFFKLFTNKKRFSHHCA
jgi:hypothetical protein